MTPIAVYQYSYLPISETFIYRQLQGLAKRFDIHLFSLLSENRELFPGFSPAIIPNKSFLERLSRRYTTTTFTPSRKRFIVDILKKTKLLHVNFGHMALSMQDMAEEAGIPITVFFHGVDASAFLKNKDYVAEYARSKFNTVFVNSENMRQRLAPYLSSSTQMRVVRYGVDPSLFTFKLRTNVPRGATFLQVSRLDYKKGIDVTLEVFNRYRREVDSSARFIIAGDGPLREALQSQANKLGMEQQVQFIGKVNQLKVIELLHSGDVLLQHSVVAPDGDMEGLPNILIEAMACGLPSVSTYHSGIPELITNGETGLLVNENDTDAYFKALVSLAKIDIASMSKNAREKVERDFNADNNNKLLCDYIIEVLQTLRYPEC